MTTHSQRAMILYRRRRFINHLLTYLLTLLISAIIITLTLTGSVEVIRRDTRRDSVLFLVPDQVPLSQHGAPRAVVPNLSIHYTVICFHTLPVRLCGSTQRFVM